MIQSTALPPLAQPIISAVAVGYFAVVAAIGIWATRQTRTASDFFVAGQGIGLWALAIASMAAKKRLTPRKWANSPRRAFIFP